MEKIQVLKFSQIVLAPIGLYSYRLTEPINEFYTSFAAYYILFFEIVFLTIATGVFVFVNVSDIALALQTCSLVVGGIQGAGMFFSVGSNMLIAKDLHIKLQEIVDKGKTFKIFENFHIKLSLALLN